VLSSSRQHDPGLAHRIGVETERSEHDHRQFADVGRNHRDRPMSSQWLGAIDDVQYAVLGACEASQRCKATVRRSVG